MHGGMLVAQVLQSNGIKHIFTLCGGHISPILVAAKSIGIAVIDTRHEVNAAFCADAMARLTGRPGVAAVTAGPGVTNTLTAIKNAQLAQSPLVLIGGATATLLRGKGSLQDINQMELIQPHVKWASRPNRLKEVVPAMQKAFAIAQQGVPGPVFVELAVDLLYPEEVVRDWYKKETDKPNPKPVERVISTYIKWHLNRLFKSGSSRLLSPSISSMLPDKKSVRRAAKIIAKAQSPVMVIGSQTMLYPDKAEELIAAVEKLQIPVFLSGMARGLLGSSHSLQMRHKRRQALKQADVVVLCGVPCDFRLNYGSHVRRAKVISINRSNEDLYKNRKPDLPIFADPHHTIVSISEQHSYEKNTDWIKQLKSRHEKREQEILQLANENVGLINPLQLCLAIDKSLQDKSILIGDGGDFVATASYIIQPRGPYCWLDPGVFGTLGVGAGFAMGAKLARPDHDVWLLYGDGAAGFSIMEFDSCVRNNIPIIAVVGNDAGWTQIARDQVVILKDDVATSLTHMDYHVVAQACGGVGIKVETVDQIPEAIDKALTSSRAGKPVLINALIGKTDFRKGSISI